MEEYKKAKVQTYNIRLRIYAVNSNTGQNGKLNNSNYRYSYFNNAVNKRRQNSI